jgi:hypothetical protein
MDKNRKLWIGAGIVVVMVVVCLVTWWFAVEKVSVKKAPAVVAVHALKGQLTAGFPKELILDSTAALSDSYAINYSSSTNQYTAEWISSSSSDALYDTYHAYITKNGWTITNQADGSGLKGIYATKASSALNIIMVPQTQSKGTKVMIAYVAK